MPTIFVVLYPTWGPPLRITCSPINQGNTGDSSPPRALRDLTKTHLASHSHLRLSPRRTLVNLTETSPQRQSPTPPMYKPSGALQPPSRPLASPVCAVSGLDRRWIDREITPPPQRVWRWTWFSSPPQLTLLWVLWLFVWQPPLVDHP